MKLPLRQAQVEALACQGKLNKEIAHELGLTTGTVKQYMRIVLRKRGVTNRTELAAKFYTKKETFKRWFVRLVKTHFSARFGF